MLLAKCEEAAKILAEFHWMENSNGNSNGYSKLLAQVPVSILEVLLKFLISLWMLSSKKRLLVKFSCLLHREMLICIFQGCV